MLCNSLYIYLGRAPEAAATLEPDRQRHKR